MPVSIQLVSPARGELPKALRDHRIYVKVSIQLVSPARGEPENYAEWATHLEESFHSIGFPCERGTWIHFANVLTGERFKFPFNWFPLREGNPKQLPQSLMNDLSFHSIGFPCERGTTARQASQERL